MTDDCKPVDHPHADRRNWRPEDDEPPDPFRND
jgi:hypothetical protein